MSGPSPATVPAPAAASTSARIADEYTAIKVTNGANTVGADAFVAFLGSALARRIFANAGLSPA